MPANRLYRFAVAPNVKVFGHSRTFTSANAASLRPLLRTVAEQGDRYRFGLFSDLPLADYRRFWGSPEAARVPREDATA